MTAAIRQATRPLKPATQPITRATRQMTPPTRKIQTLILAVVLGAAGTALAATSRAAGSRYTDLRIIEPIHGNAATGKTKAAVCFACHGAEGVSIAPTFPRLAGQREDYLYHRLISFGHSDPKDPYYSVSPMTAIAAALSDADMRDLAAFFAAQTVHAPQAPAAPEAAPPSTAAPAAAAASAAAPPATTAPAAAPPSTAAPAAPATAPPTASPVTAQTGEALFLHGNPARGIPPCQGCHGADAKGPSSVADQYAAYPSLRGQYAPYVTARLTNFRKGQPSDTSNTFIMHGVAETLDDDSIDAVAAWLASLQ